MPSTDIKPVEIAASLRDEASSRRTLLSWAAGLIGILALILVVLHVGSLERIFALARTARPGWLLLALLVQAATYLCAALVWRQALRRAEHPRLLRTLFPLAVAKLFTDQALPSSGISGTMLVVSGLVRRRVPLAIAMAAMLSSLVSYDIAYLTVVLTSAGILRLHDSATLTLLIGVGIFVVVIIAVPSTILGLKRRSNGWPVTWLKRLPGMAVVFRALAEAPTDLLYSPILLIQTTILQVGIFTLDALTLWLAFHALGDVPAFWVVFVSFVMASMAATIGPIPIGLGTFEAGSVAMLNFLGVSIEAALAATLLMRGLSFWFPMLPGIWLTRREISRL